MSEEIVEQAEEIVDVTEQADVYMGQYPEIAEKYVALDVLRSILGHFDAAEAPIDEYEGDDGELILDVSAPDLAVLIGRHGKTLDSLQILVSLLTSRRLGFRYPVVVDLEGYKSRRKDKLSSMARSAASRAVRQGSSVSLPAMNPYERRLIHLALRDCDDVLTHSEGMEPERHVVIVPVRS